jgi:hypothetical protein
VDIRRGIVVLKRIQSENEITETMIKLNDDKFKIVM